MRAVYGRCVVLSEGEGGEFVSDLPGSYLRRIDNGQTLIETAATWCNAMINDLRLSARTEGVRFSAHIASGYRSATRQFTNWQTEFPGYYNDTIDTRRRASGGEHGRAAVNLLAAYIRRFMATPGYSHHQDGLAVDFEITERGVSHGISRTEASTTGWRHTWFWTWMNDHASNFGFYQNEEINEPWHWEFRTVPPSMRGGPTALA